MEGAEAPTTLFDRVDPDQENIVTYAYTFEDLFFEGEAWWHVLERNSRGGLADLRRARRP